MTARPWCGSAEVRSPSAAQEGRAGWPAAGTSNRTTGRWGVAFTSGGQALLKTVGPRSGSGPTVRASRGCPGSPGGSSSSGGTTLFAPANGIVTFVQAGSNLCYFNKNSGNTDDLAHGDGPITEVSTSARANFVAFTSSATSFPFDGNGAGADVFFKHLIGGQAL
jgi:hypothetical protein